MNVDAAWTAYVEKWKNEIEPIAKDKLWEIKTNDDWDINEVQKVRKVILHHGVTELIETLQTIEDEEPSELLKKKAKKRLKKIHIRNMFNSRSGSETILTC